MHKIFKTGLSAAKKNIGPGLLLQGFALTLVLFYYFHEPTRQFLMKIPEIQQWMGLLFPILVTALFGGVIPCLFLIARKEIPKERHLSEMLFMIGFWGLMGLCINALYIALAHLFGNDPDAATIIKKVLVDQFVWCVVFIAPVTTLAMLWKENHFSLRATKNDLSRTFITRDIPTFLITLWAVWVPTTAIVYSLPLALQFPMFNIVLCFWSLLLTAISKKS
jgi:hypothetical protein